MVERYLIILVYSYLSIYLSVCMYVCKGYQENKINLYFKVCNFPDQEKIPFILLSGCIKNILVLFFTALFSRVYFMYSSKHYLRLHYSIIIYILCNIVYKLLW